MRWWDTCVSCCCGTRCSKHQLGPFYPKYWLSRLFLFFCLGNLLIDDNSMFKSHVNAVLESVSYLILQQLFCKAGNLTRYMSICYRHTFLFNWSLHQYITLFLDSSDSFVFKYFACWKNGGCCSWCISVSKEYLFFILLLCVYLCWWSVYLTRSKEMGPVFSSTLHSLSFNWRK